MAARPPREKPLQKRSRAQRRWLEHLPVWAAQAAILGLVSISPWVFGGVRAGFQTWCFAPLMFALLCWAVILPQERKKGRPAIPLALVPLLFGLALGGLQLLPVGETIRSFVSPQATQWRKLLTSTAGLQTEMPPGSQRASAPPAADTAREPMSIYPAATERQLALLTMATCAFALGAQFFRRTGMQLLLCLVAAINGAAIATMGIAQRISGSIFYLSRPSIRYGSFGSFFNENNAAGYLNMCLACSLAALYWLIIRNRPAPIVTFADGIPLEQPNYRSRLKDRWSRICISVGSLKASTLGLFLVAVLLLAGVLCSLSRGAWLALVLAAVLTNFAIRRRRISLPVFSSLGLGAVLSVGLIIWLGADRLIERRAATLLSWKDMLGDARLGNWLESLRALGDYWITGSGLGTYGYAYLPYQQQTSNAWHLHAENQYVEALIDGGLPGLMLLFAELALVLLALRSSFRNQSEASSAGLVACGTLLVLTQALHGIVDFGLYLPANFILLATLCGSFCGRAAWLEANFSLKPRSFWVVLPGSGAACSSALVLGLAVFVLVSWQQTSRAAAVENAMAAARWDDEDPRRPIADVEQAVDRLTAAVRNRWNDGEAHLRLAELWTELYRLHALDQFKRELPKTGEAQLWRLTDLDRLHSRAAELASVKNTTELARMRYEPVVADYLVPAWNHLLWARSACPWLAEVHFELATLCFLDGDPRLDQNHLEHVKLLARYDPTYLYLSGLLDLGDDRTAQAWREFKTSWSLSLEYHYSILAIACRRLTMAQMLEQVIPASPEILIKLVRERYQGQEHAYDRGLLMQRIGQLLSTLPLKTADRYHAQAGFELLKNNVPEALADYQRAVELDPSQYGWRQDWLALLKKVQSADAIDRVPTRVGSRAVHQAAQANHIP